MTTQPCAEGPDLTALDLAEISLSEAIGRVLRHSVIAPLLADDSEPARIPGFSGQMSPRLRTGDEASVLILIDLAQPHTVGPRYLQGSVLAQIFGQAAPIAQTPSVQSFAPAIQKLIAQLAADGQVWACQLRSTGGLLVAACRMAFAARAGVSLNLDMLTIDPASADWGDYKIRAEQVAVQRHEAALTALFSEAAGVLLQVSRAQRDVVLGRLRQAGLSACSHVVGSLNDADQLQVFSDGKCIYQALRAELLAANPESSGLP